MASPDDREAVSRKRAISERLVGKRVTDFLGETRRNFRIDRRQLLSEQGRQTKRLLTQRRNAYRGQRCVIIGNGPSLNRTPVELLASEWTFGLNRIYLMRDRLGFDPSFHVVVNRLVVEQCAAELLTVPGSLYTTWPNRDLLGARRDAVFMQNEVLPGFSPDPRRGVWEGATVTYVAMQVAYFLGFHEVVLIGVDHSFATKGPAHETVVSDGPDPNHFDPKYFGKGFRWQLPDLEMSEIAYRMARAAFEAEGRRIIDCTVGGQLTVFPKADLENVLAAPQPPVTAR